MLSNIEIISVMRNRFTEEDLEKHSAVRDFRTTATDAKSITPSMLIIIQKVFILIFNSKKINHKWSHHETVLLYFWAHPQVAASIETIALL